LGGFVAIHTSVVKSGDGNEEQRNPMDEMSDMFGPGHVDQTVRQAIQSCWMALPKERRTPEEVEKQIRHIFDRALANFREDAVTFCKTK
jgi:BMFP domain-containing protein YqiC